MKKKNRFSVPLAGGLLAAGVVAGATKYFYRTAVKRSVKKVVADNHKNMYETTKSEEELADQEWLHNKGANQVFINSEDHLRLHALYIPAKKETLKCVILAHGYGGECSEMVGLARLYAEKFHFNVLIPDARGHGKSDGTYIGFGWHERFDYVKWVHYLLAQHGRRASIVLHGVSMGGATVLMTSGEVLPKQVNAIISDCAYTSAADVLKHQLKQMYRLPAFPFLPLASLYTKCRSGYSFYEASAVKQVKRAEVPILFIHGDKDTFVPFEMVHTLYKAGKTEDELIVIPNAEHGMAFFVSPGKYENSMHAFLNKHIQQKGK